MSKSLRKVQKGISKKKGSNVSLHENSRDFRKLRRAASRSQKLERQEKHRNVPRELIMERIQWFAKRATPLDNPISLDTVQSHINLYEKTTQVAALAASRRPNRPKSSEQGRLEQIVDADVREYKSGFWLPDMMNEGGRKALAEWYEASQQEQAREWARLDRLQYVRITPNGDVRRSNFPPNGDS